jgi:hypothetical protein
MALATAGGLDELLMMLAPVLTFIVVRRIARGRPADRAPNDRPPDKNAQR